MSFFHPAYEALEGLFIASCEEVTSGAPRGNILNLSAIIGDLISLVNLRCDLLSIFCDASSAVEQHTKNRYATVAGGVNWFPAEARSDVAYQTRAFSILWVHEQTYQPWPFSEDKRGGQISNRCGHDPKQTRINWHGACTALDLFPSFLNTECRLSTTALPFPPFRIHGDVTFSVRIWIIKHRNEVAKGDGKTIFYFFSTRLRLSSPKSVIPRSSVRDVIFIWWLAKELFSKGENGI